MLPFSRKILISKSQYLSTSPETPSQVLSQFLRCKNYVKIGVAVMHFRKKYL